MPQPLALLLVAAGIFTLICGIGNWDWFMNHRKARAMTRLIGRPATRILYIVLGLIIAILGVLLAFGIVD